MKITPGVYECRNGDEAIINYERQDYDGVYMASGRIRNYAHERQIWCLDGRFNHQKINKETHNWDLIKRIGDLPKGNL